MSVFTWSLLAVAAVALLCLGAYRFTRRDKNPPQLSLPGAPTDREPKIRYVPSDMEWSGSTNSIMPLKTLTYKQYECLEDARYGFSVVGVTPSERKNLQPHKTRAHGLKTVSSLVKHGFLNAADQNGGHVITDLGLNALEVCDVRY